MKKYFFLVTIISLFLLTGCKKKNLDPIEFSVKEGIYGNQISLELLQKQGAEIFYTVNGEDPNVKFRQEKRYKYQKTKPIILELQEENTPSKFVIKVIARKKGYNIPTVITKTYEIKPKFQAPTFNIQNGLVTRDKVTIKMFYENFNLGKAEIRYSITKLADEKSEFFDKFDKGQSPFDSVRYIEFSDYKYYKLTAKVISLDPNVLSSDVSTIEFQIDKNAKVDDYSNNSSSYNSTSSTEGFFYENTPSKQNSSNNYFVEEQNNIGKTEILNNSPKLNEESKEKQFEGFVKKIEKNSNELIINTIEKDNIFYVLSEIKGKAILTTYSDTFNELKQVTINENPKKLKIIDSVLYLLTENQKNNIYSVDKNLNLNLIKETESKIKDFTILKKNIYAVMESNNKFIIKNFSTQEAKNIDVSYSENIPFQLSNHNNDLILCTEKDNSKGLTSINLIKFDETLNEIFNKVYGGGNREFFSKLFIQNNTIFVLGTTSSFVKEENNKEKPVFSNFILKINSKGTLTDSNSFSENSEKGEDFGIINEELFVLSSSNNNHIKLWKLNKNDLQIKDSIELAEGKGKQIILNNKKWFSFGNYINGSNYKNIIISANGV